MSKEIIKLLDDIRTYLEYQKVMGADAIPKASAKGRSGGGEIKPGSAHVSVRKQERADKRTLLDKLREEIGDCRRCRLWKTRTNLVFGTGNPNASLMFVGEGPGYDEDKKGEPFVGKAGQLLTRIIEAMGLKRSDVYIANVVKCRPPENRNPEPDEMDICMPFLLRQIEIISPKVIICLGTFAAQRLLGTDMKITSLRGRFYERNGIQIMPTYHPAYLLRNPNMKRAVWEDVKKVMEIL